jgi:hypothetical protein
MTALIVASLAAALELDGVYGVEVDPPANTPTPGLDWVGFVGRFAWGPVGAVHVVDGQADYLDTFAPGGLGYSATGHKSLARAKASRLKIARVGATGFGAPTSGAVANQGTAGSTSYSYKVVAVSGTKAGAATSAITTTTGAASLTGTNFNRLTWAAPAAGVNITGYRVYRTAGGGSTGLIGTVAGDVLQLDDTGLAGDSASVPTVNSTVMATASMVLQSSGAVNILSVSAKYPGDLGSSVTIVVAAADDGVSSHFNLTASLGTESETYRNLSTLSTGAGVVLGSQASSKILAALSAVTANLGASTRPVNGTYTLGAAASNVASPVAGSDGVSLAADYTGTAGTGDAGLALFEGDEDVTIVAPDDCTSALRLAVNTALVAHAEAESRGCYLVLDSGTTLAAAITYLNTNAAALRSERAILAWPWVYQLDSSGVRELVPSAGIRAGALSKMIRSLGQHWKDARNTSSFRGVVALEYALNRASHITAKNGGISPLIRAGDAWAPKNDATTSLVAGKTKVARRRLADYVMKLVTAGQEPYEGGSIDPATRSRQIAQASSALQPLKDAATRGEAEITEAVEDFSVATASSGAELAAGIHKIRVQVKSFATQDFIVFLVSVGPTVTVEEIPVAA